MSVANDNLSRAWAEPPESIEPPAQTPYLIKEKEYVPILDGWRAVAIMIVLAFHGFYNTALPQHSVLHPIADLAGRVGAMGVLIFFGISGYLITMKLLQEARATGAFSMRNFYIKRVFRILPPLAAYLLVLSILYLAGVVPLRINDWSAPFFLANYFQGSWYTSHFWSLSVEEHFYFVWPACILVAGFRKSLWIGIAVAVIVGFWRSWQIGIRTMHGDPVAATLQHTDMRLDYIMMGCIAALALNYYPKLGVAFRYIGSTLGLLVMSIALYMSTLHLPFDVRSLQAVILTLMVCSTTVAKSPLLSLLLANPVLLFIGRISYSVYVWQQLFLGPSKNVMISSPYALPIKYALVLATACASYYGVEKPFIRYGRRLIVKTRPAIA